MLSRSLFNYRVSMQRADGQVVESDYAVRWSPEKVDADEVARACAAEHTVRHGFDGEHRPRMLHLGLVATLV